MTYDRGTKNHDGAWCFTRSRLTFFASLIRLVLLFDHIPSEWSKWIRSPVAQSVLVDDAFSLHTFEEALAIRRLFSPGRFEGAYSAKMHPIPPLLLAAMHPALESTTSEYWQRVSMGLILAIVDFVIALTLERIGKKVMLRERAWEEKLEKRVPTILLPPLAHIFEKAAFSKSNPTPTFGLESLPFVVAQLFYLSPIPLLAGCALHCFQNLPLLCLLIAILHGCQGSLVWSAFNLSVAAYLQVHNIVFLIPIALLLGEREKSIRKFFVLSAVLSTSFLYLDFLLVGESDYVAVLFSTHLATFKITGIAPSLSTLWYLGMEMFGRFSRYFTIFLGGLPYTLVIPTTIRLYHYPEELIAIFWILGTLFRPPGTLFSLNVGFCLLLLSPRSLARMRFVPSVIALCGLIVPVSLYMVDYWLWLETGSGEANFVFFQCLAYNVFVAILFLQFFSATLRRDKELRITEKTKVEKAD